MGPTEDTQGIRKINTDIYTCTYLNLMLFLEEKFLLLVQ
jgi:hypothetical protein